MKKVLFPVLSFLFWACSPTFPSATNPEDSFLLRVECVPGPNVQQEVIMLMRRAKAKDIRVDGVGAGLTIEAAYYKDDNSIGVLEEIADHLRQVGAVLSVSLVDNTRTVRDTR